MSRPVRVEFPGATYHVLSHGVDGAPTFVDDLDHRTFLKCVWKRNRKHGRPFTFGGDSRLARTTGAVEHRYDIQARDRGTGTDTGNGDPRNLVRLPSPHGP